ncbi:MFS transporter [Candidatus Poriferisodalis sp.]|uniref:MFS transporter n=1 Tax=Candidatus Poriferisodalis sp. TaxID=3101277 RepID=UPI003B027B9F
MTRQVRTFVADLDEVADLLRPRDDIVLEASGPTSDRSHHFVLAEGPFTSYSRHVQLSPTNEPAPGGTAAGGTAAGAASRSRVTETVEWQLAVPWFGPAINVAVRRAMRTGRTGDGRQPLWAPPQRLSARSATILAMLAAAAMLSGYLANAPSELHTYAADEFGVDQTAQGILGAVVRIGTLLAIGVSVLADRHGRRRVVAGAMAAGIGAAALAALAPNIVWLGAFLLVGRTANAALGATIVVMALEEMPAGCRAWCLSVLAMSAALGAGVVVWLQPLSDLATWAWRLLFALPLVALLAARPLLRRLPESRRFERRGRDVQLSGYWRPIALLGSIYLAFGLFLGPIDWFRNEYLRDEHGFSAALVSLFVLGTATPAGLAVYAAGRLADSRGRRMILAIASVAGLGCLVAMFNVSGSALWLLGLAGAMLSAGLLPSLGVYRAELFPTAVRARAATLTGAMGVVGAAGGVLLAGWLRTAWGSFGEVIALLWIGPLIAAGIAVLWLAERSGHELEELHPADAAVDPDGPWSPHAGT